jgi:hypothetical protein
MPVIRHRITALGTEIGARQCERWGIVMKIVIEYCTV